MIHIQGIGRLGLLAVGLGLGAALAATPGARADDMQISIDGIDLFPTAGNTATATSDIGDFAIAIGNGADANATGGIFDSAFALGTNTVANAGGGDGNLASAFDPFGSQTSFAFAGDGNFNLTSVVGEHDNGYSGGILGGPSGSDDLTDIFGNNDFLASGASQVNPGDFDLAAIFGDGFTSSAATGGNFLLDLLP